MKLIEAKCPNCGAVLSADEKKDAMICPYCGSAFIVTEAVQNFHNHYTTINNIQAENVFVQDTAKQNGFEIVNNVLIKYTGAEENVVIPEGIVEIGRGAFSFNKRIKSVKIPSTLRYIDENAFCGCIKLEDIHPLGNIIEVGRNAFSETAVRTLNLINAETLGELFVYECNHLNELRVSSKAISYPLNLSITELSRDLSIYVDDKLVTVDSPYVEKFLGTYICEQAKKNKREAWIKAGRCKYCGGELKLEGGFFSKERICKSCRQWQR